MSKHQKNCLVDLKFKEVLKKKILNETIKSTIIKSYSPFLQNPKRNSFFIY